MKIIITRYDNNRASGGNYILTNEYKKQQSIKKDESCTRIRISGYSA